MSTPAPDPDRPNPDQPAVPDRPVLPDRAGDDLDVGWGDPGERSRDDDERFLRERPPHWE